MSETKSIADLVKATGKSVEKLAEEAGISYLTIYRARASNKWPLQKRVRAGLEKVLLPKGGQQ